MVHVFKVGDPFVVLAQHFGKGGFARADITRNSDVFWFLSFCHNCLNSEFEIINPQGGLQSKPFFGLWDLCFLVF
jgi:hypothetical protein